MGRLQAAVVNPRQAWEVTLALPVATPRAARDPLVRPGFRRAVEVFPGMLPERVVQLVLPPVAGAWQVPCPELPDRPVVTQTRAGPPESQAELVTRAMLVGQLEAGMLDPVWGVRVAPQ